MRHFMRLFLLALMIVLLPLRTWAGDAMTMRMLDLRSATQSSSCASHPTAQVHNLDHLGAPASAHHSSATTDHTDAATPAHTTCDACVLVMWVDQHPAVDTPERPHSRLQRRGSTGFTSAWLRGALRPPKAA
jgi:hypothetical protein